MNDKESSVMVTRTMDINDAHRAMGHLNYQAIKKIEDACSGLIIRGKQEIECVPCIEAKARRISFTLGFIDHKSDEGYTCYAIYKHHESNLLFLVVMKRKDEQYCCFKEYLAIMERQYGIKIGILKCDNGGEFKNERMTNLCKILGTKIEYATPYTPEQNSIAERSNRTVVETARSMILDSECPKKYWADALKTAVYLRNRSPRSEDSRTPIKVLTGQKPYLGNVQKWGITCWLYIEKKNRGKIDAKTVEYWFLGYTGNGYVVAEKSNGRRHNSCHVTFSKKAETEHTNEQVHKLQEEDSDSEDDAISNEIPRTEESNDIGRVDPEIEQDSDNFSNQEEDVDNITQEDIHGGKAHVRQSTRTDGKGYVWQLVPSSQIAPKDIPSNIDPKNIISGKRRVTFAGATKSKSSNENERNNEYASEPNNYEEAMKSTERLHWKNAIDEELASLTTMGTWKETTLPKGKNLIDSKWVFKLKKDEFGRPVRYKARLVARGFKQKVGEDYDQTFAPVMRIESLRILIALSARYNWKMRQIDIKSAYLNADIDKDLYMALPKGYSNQSKGTVLKLEKGLYGLHQSAKIWNDNLVERLTTVGFTSLMTDNCVMKIEINGNLIYCAFWVDNLHFLEVYCQH